MDSDQGQIGAAGTEQENVVNFASNSQAHFVVLVLQIVRDQEGHQEPRINIVPPFPIVISLYDLNCTLSSEGF